MDEKEMETFIAYVRTMLRFYLQHPREYLRAFYTGHIVPATYRWARKIKQIGNAVCPKIA